MTELYQRPSRPPPTAGGGDEPARSDGELLDPPRVVGWGPTDVLIGIGYAIGLLLLGAIVAQLLDPPKGADNKQHSATVIALQAATGASLVAAAYFAIHSYGQSRAFALGWRPAKAGRIRILRLSVPTVLVYFVAAAATYLVISQLVSVLTHPSQDDIPDNLGYGATTIGDIAIILLLVVVAPIGEEIFFRGFMFAGLRGAVPAVPAAILSSALWASLHLGEADVAAAFQLFVFGLILCWLYDRTGSVRSTILLHAVNNTFAVVFLLTH